MASITSLCTMSVLMHMPRKKKRDESEKERELRLLNQYCRMEKPLKTSHTNVVAGVTIEFFRLKWFEFAFILILRSEMPFSYAFLCVVVVRLDSFHSFSTIYAIFHFQCVHFGFHRRTAEWKNKIFERNGERILFVHDIYHLLRIFSSPFVVVVTFSWSFRACIIQQIMLVWKITLCCRTSNISLITSTHTHTQNRLKWNDEDDLYKFSMCACVCVCSHESILH